MQVFIPRMVVPFKIRLDSKRIKNAYKYYPMDTPANEKVQKGDATIFYVDKS